MIHKLALVCREGGRRELQRCYVGRIGGIYFKLIGKKMGVKKGGKIIL